MSLVPAKFEALRRAQLQMPDQAPNTCGCFNIPSGVSCLIGAFIASAAARLPLRCWLFSLRQTSRYCVPNQLIRFDNDQPSWHGAPPPSLKFAKDSVRPDLAQDAHEPHCLAGPLQPVVPSVMLDETVFADRP
jgi:hypothetical protein